MFWKKKDSKLNSDEYERLYKKIVSTTGDIDEMKAKLSGLHSQLCSMRSSFNQHKIKEKPVEESEDLNNSVLLTNNGIPVSNQQGFGLS